jgi:hypothetical protein
MSTLKNLKRKRMNEIYIKIKPHLDRVRKKFNNNYFILTMTYMSIYSIIGTVVICGGNYLINGTMDYGQLVVNLSLMLTVGTMAKKLKDDLVSNYWKLRKMKQRQVRGKK